MASFLFVTSLFFQDLVEVVMTLKYAAERMTGQAVEVNTGALSEQLTKYASILAAQGALSAALTYLGQSNEVRKLIILVHDRRNDNY